MAYDLQRAVKLLTSDNNDEVFLKAVWIYEFQVALLYPKFLALGGPTDTSIRHQELRSARLLAAMALMDYLDRKEIPGKPKKLQIARRDREFRRLYNRVIVPAGAWRSIKHTPASQDFHKLLETRKEAAYWAAKVVDCSYRHSKLNLARKTSSTMARFIVWKSSHYNYGKSENTLQSQWTKYKASALFLYLQQYFGSEFSLPNVSGRGFAERLIKLAAKPHVLRSYFATYSAIRNHLSKFGFNFPDIVTVPGEINLPPAQHFPLDVLNLISTYSNKR